MTEATRQGSGWGRLAARNLDLELQLRETRERLRLLDTRLRPDTRSDLHAPPRVQQQIDPLEDDRNRMVLAAHLEVCEALANSLPWRLVERAAAPFRERRQNPVLPGATIVIESLANPFDVRRLLDESAEYLTRVLGSREWRVLQAVRRVFGRQW